jgi:chromosome segregation ATPase
MEERKSDFEEQTTSVVPVEEMSLEESQLAEQLYSNAGLGPVVEAGLKDYDNKLRKEDKLISKVFGARGSDIKSYGESVAKRVAFAVYTLLNRQYGGKVGDLRSYIMTLQEERDRANTRYDELMGRVVGILGEEYKNLRTDSKEFMEKLTTVLGEDLQESRIDKKELAERLADIDGLRLKIRKLEEEKVKLNEDHELQIAALRKEHAEAVEDLKSNMAELDSKIEKMESEKTALANDLGQLENDHERLKKSMVDLAGSIPDEEIGKKLRDELYRFILEDSKVPDKIIGGVGKFIDFKKYLGLAADRGAEELGKRVEEILGSNP